MRRVMSFGILAWALTTAACESRPMDPGQQEKSPPTLPPMFSLATNQDPVGVTISGPESVGPADDYVGGVEYSATVTNGTGPYYYHWRVRYCAYYEENSYGEPGVECQTDYGGTGYTSDGLSLNPVKIEVWDKVTEFDILLQVREDIDGYVTGVDSMHVYGPYFAQQFLAPADGEFHCSITGGGYYFDEWKYDNGAWKRTGREYRRNACSGSREYDPTKPDTTTS